jgi:hypothetical protein
MFARQKARKDSTAVLRRAIPRAFDWVRGAFAAQSSDFKASYYPETLERRVLLTTINSLGQQGTFDFFTSQGMVDEIAFNDVTFEAVGSHVNQSTGAIQLGDLVPASDPEPAQGANLYYLYVTQSNADSFIAVYQLSGLGGAPEPFAAPSVGSFFAPGSADGLATIPTNTGGVFLGDVNPVSVPVNAVYTGVPLPGGLGLVPDPGQNGLNPGIDVLPINAATGEPNNFGNLLIAGTVTGSVTIGGNLNQFYGGVVLTGDINGDPTTPLAAPTDARTDPNNFSVAGDLREFVTAGPVGTDGVGGGGALNYVTSFDLSVGGKIGEIHVGNTELGTVGTLAGTIEAGNSPLISGQTAYPTSSPANLTGIWTDQTEVEDTGGPTDGGIPLLNDTAADAQILGSVPVLNPTSGLPEKDASGNIIYQASVNGTTGDGTDFYAVPVEAGKTFRVSLSSGTLEVFDPDGRLVDSNSRSGTGPQQITADRPGLYTFAVLGSGYNLTVTNVGNMAIGGISLTGDYSDIGVNKGIIAGIGDIGAINLAGTYFSTTTGPTPATADPNASPNTSVPVTASTSILVASGDLRALIAANLGELNAAGTGLLEGPTLSVPNGSVGLIRSTTGVLNFNCQFDPNYQSLATPQFVTDDAYASAIGGSIQIIDAATTLQTDLAVNAGVGTIHAGNMATDTASYIDVNADNKGQDGIIDLIDVVGSFGDAVGGGPQIVTHNGGDIRYMFLQGPVFRDEYFGGGQDTGVTYPSGQTVHFTDQAGNVITVVPIGPVTTTTTTVTNTPANASTGVTTTKTTSNTSGATITVDGYQIRDKGGIVPIAIVASDSMEISATGTGPHAQVNIGELVIQGTGSNVSNGGLDLFGNTMVTQAPGVFTAATNDGTTTTTTTNSDGSTTTTSTTIAGGGTTTSLTLQLTGAVPINSMIDLSLPPPGVADGGYATLIENDTQGETGIIQAQQVGTIISHGNIGYLSSVATPAFVAPSLIVPNGNTYPFSQQHTGVDITGNPTVPGNAVAIDAYGGIGNVLINGTVNSIIANYPVSIGNKGAKPIPGNFNGIVGPIEGTSLLSIDIGQGLIPSGSGNVAGAGIFGSGVIGLVDNFGNPNGDIRGNIVSEDDNNFNGTTYVPGLAIGEISLVNASIIDARVIALNNIVNGAPVDLFAETSDLGGGFSSPEPNELPFASPYVYEIGSTNVSGKGGIIGTDFTATNIGPVSVYNGGFGILDTVLDSQDLGRIGGLTASGYGIRNSKVTQCGYLGPVVTTGSGALISVLNYPIDVRESDVPNQLDPYFGFTPGAATDINANLGTSLQTPNIPGVTDTGVIQDDVFQGQESFAGLSTQKVRTAEPLYTAGVTLPTPTVPNVPVLGVDFPMEINFATSVGNIHIYQQVDGLQITTGNLIGFYSGVSVSRLGISTAGEVDAVLVHGNLGNFITDRATDTLIPDSYINAGGASGIIGTIKVLGNLSANISATGKINSIIVTGDLLGSLTAEGQSNSLTLGSLLVYGGIRDNSLVLDGSVGSIIVNGTLGTSAGKLSINGSANLISVGNNNRQKGSTLGLALYVLGTLSTLRVHGTITGTVATGGDLTNLVVNGDGTAANVIQNTITVGGRIGSATITGGNVAANVTANGYINSFTINRGSLLYGNTIQSVLDSIHNFTTTGGAAYGMFGSLLATNGGNVNLNISGNIGDGTDPAVVSAYTGTKFLVHGTITGHSTITVQGQLNLLQVIGNIQSGAVISAHPLVTQKITGTNDGSITIV